MTNSKKKIGVAGLGTVGGSVYKFLNDSKGDNSPEFSNRYEIIKVLNRSRQKYLDYSIPYNMIADNIDDLVESSDIIIETIGGTTIAKDLATRALEQGKFVITANKDLLSQHGNELLQYISPVKRLYFEASVGGAIPIISVLENQLRFQNISMIRGVMNGTTNFIINKIEEGSSLKEAIKIAQDAGFAESNPEKDVMGLDSAYKLSVLAGVITNNFPGIEQIKINGIMELDEKLVRKEFALGKRMKLFGEINLGSGKGEIKLKSVKIENPFYNLQGVENAIEIDTLHSGSFFLKGLGAGAGATTSAIIGDLYRIIQNNFHIK